MHISNSNVRLVTINEDGSVEILFKDQTFMDIPKERVEFKGKERITLYTSDAGIDLFAYRQSFWAWEDKRNANNIKITVYKEDTEIDGDDIFIKKINSVKIV